MQASLIATATLAFASYAAMQPENWRFGDVPPLSPVYAAVEFVAEEGIMTGLKTTQKFEPQGVLSRAELLKIIIEATEADDMLADCLQAGGWLEYGFVFFKDVTPDDWFAPHVCLAQKRGMVKGFADGTFRPAQKVRFTEVAKLLEQAFVLPGAEGREWFESPVNALADRLAIPETVRSFDSLVTRGEIAEIIYRLKNPAIAKPSRTLADLQAAFEPHPCENCLVIDKIGIKVPIVFGVGDSIPADAGWQQQENTILRALREGVVHYPGTALPGQLGNTFLTGHSSYYRDDPGKFNTVFAKLGELAIGDTYRIYYNSQEFTYQIVEEKIVLPREVDVLAQPDYAEVSSLMTCWPVNTNFKRKIFVANRIE